MNRTDRLLAMVLELQAKGWQRAEDFASTFEISKRTVYRDMEALAESGVPIVSVPGQGYSLMEGYFLPPLSFSPDEAVILLLGSDYMVQNFDAEYQKAARSASSKISAVMNETLREAVRHLEATMRFIAPTSDLNDPEILRKVRRAIIQGRTLRFEYHTRHTDEIGGTKTVRDADPYALIHWDRSWYMMAYCHLRREVRNFRLDRIDRLDVLNKMFNRPADFSIHAEHLIDRPVTVRVLFDAAVERWVREEQPFFAVDYTTTVDGLLVTLRVRREEDVFRWLLGWGAHVRVLEPHTLRERILNEAAAILEKSKTAESLLP